MRLTEQQRQLVADSTHFVTLEAGNGGRWIDPDTRQTALEALCRAASTFDPARSSWHTWARTQIRYALAAARREWNGRAITPERVQHGAAVLHATASRTREDPVDQLIDRIDGERAFAALPGSPRNKQMVLERAAGATIAELADRYEISEARVSQITFAVIGRAGVAQAIRSLPKRPVKQRPRARAVPTLSQLGKPTTSSDAPDRVPRTSHAGPGQTRFDPADHDTVEVPGSSPVTPTE